MIDLNLFIESLTSGYKSSFFNFFSFISIFFGVSVIISKNPIVSVLFLISLFLAIASYLILLGMYFLGLVYLLVYVGAISILFIFILMLINIRISELTTDNNNSVPLAIIVGTIFIMSLYNILPYSIHMLNFIRLGNIFENLFETVDFVKYNSNIFNENIVNDTGFVLSNRWDNNLVETSHIVGIGNIMYSEVFIWLIVVSYILLLAMVGAILITIKPSNV